MKIAIIGASGCVGSDLTQYLLDTTSHRLVLFSHRATELTYSKADEKRLRHINGDILNQNDIKDALRGCEVAVYLVHLMGERRHRFDADERRAAKHFVLAVHHSGVRNVVYVGGMGHADDTPTKHLASRERTAKIFLSELKNVTVLHTPMIIGKDAAGFEVIRSIVKYFRILPIPAWSNGTTYPITVRDVSHYVTASLKSTGRHSVDIGGPDSLSYAEIIEQYAMYKNKRIYLIPVPFIPRSVVARTFRLFKRSKAAITVSDMIGSSSYSTKTNMTLARTLYPSVDPTPIQDGFY